jgi:uncharacterized LabA/DUF88 family protein
MNTSPETSTLDKMLSVHEDSQKIWEFLNWLEREKNMHMCKLDNNNFYARSYVKYASLLAEYFEIDLKQAEKEKVALLEYQREINKLKV